MHRGRLAFLSAGIALILVLLPAPTFASGSSPTEASTSWDSLGWLADIITLVLGGPLAIDKAGVVIEPGGAPLVEQGRKTSQPSAQTSENEPSDEDEAGVVIEPGG